MRERIVEGGPPRMRGWEKAGEAAKEEEEGEEGREAEEKRRRGSST